MKFRFDLTFVVMSLALAVGTAAVDTAVSADKEPAKEPAKAVIGKSQPTWAKLPGTDDKEHSLADLKDREVVVVAITCNHCPIAIEYFERLNEFAKKHCGEKGKVALVAISVSDMETDKMPRMKQVAERQGFKFPYLYDESQKIAKDLGATNTPQFFVLDRHRTLAYRGAWDDEVNATKVKERHVEAAVEALLAGKTPLVAETSAKGCLISYKDE
jgi:peroxiredoxin